MPESDALNDKNEKKRQPPPAIQSKDPEPELERKLERNPDDANTKVDVGSDESMDASDPVSIALPEHKEPAPSSGFDEDDSESKT